ncbi:MAG: hypothetical protein H0U08_02330 [Actinobacteria bacterium]|nr:hypothetical protein [Actinomycetota bacterium]
MLHRTLVLGLLALCALVALPALASGQSLEDLFDETEPQTVIDKVKASKKGTVKVYFHGTDPVDPPEDLTYDCAVDPGKGGGGDEDEDGWDDEDDEGWEDDPDIPGVPFSSGPSEVECPSPWVAKGLEPGRHTVEVIAFDYEWNEDSTPATAQFKVKKRK